MEQDTEKQNNLNQANKIENLVNQPDVKVGLESLIDKEIGAQAAQQETAASLPPVPVFSSNTTSADDVTTGVSVDDSNPAIAEDDDLIEKEWVDKAKQIVSENKKDPYEQEEKVSNLKIDYLKKRFGRELGNTK